MSLIVQIQNDGTGTQELANYKVTVYITTVPPSYAPLKYPERHHTELALLGAFGIRDHNRGDGWRALLKRVGEEAAIG